MSDISDWEMGSTFSSTLDLWIGRSGREDSRSGYLSVLPFIDNQGVSPTSGRSRKGSKSASFILRVPADDLSVEKEKTGLHVNFEKYGSRSPSICLSLEQTATVSSTQAETVKINRNLFHRPEGSRDFLTIICRVKRDLRPAL